MPLSRAATIFVIPALVTAYLSVLAGNALADANDVKGLISEQCIKCHAVPGLPTKQLPKSISAPGFADIANNPKEYTDERLRKFFEHPHYPMGQFIPSPSDIDNIIAFIKTLRPKN